MITPPSIQQTGDGGYIVAGYSDSTDIPGLTNHGGSDYDLLKLDADGNGPVQPSAPPTGVSVV